MPRKPKKQARSKKRQRAKAGGVRALRVRIKKAERISSHEVEEAIEKKLASMRTDVFGNDDTLIIVVEQEDY